MMLALDHVPFYRSTDATLSAFHSLGFVCSPRGSYRSPQYPSSVWETNCVFLQQGWFDLLRGARLITRAEVAVPGGCLFLTSDLQNSLTNLDPEGITARYSLERCWHGVSGPGERFDLASLRESPCQLPLAIIQHNWPCDDVKAEWTAHPNGAVCLEAVFCLKQTLAPTKSFPHNDLLDSSRAQDLAAESFRSRFGTDQVRVAVRVRVADLALVRRHVRKSTLRNSGSGADRIVVHPCGMACVFEFVE